MIWFALVAVLMVAVFLARFVRRRDLVPVPASEPMSAAVLGRKGMTPQKKAALRAANNVLR